MSIKIQLNSLAALERLIGGDSETEIDIRNSIVQEFTKRHLKTIADDHVNKLKSEILTTILKEAESQLGEYSSGWQRYFKLSAPIHEAISKRVKNEFDLFLDSYISKKLEEISLDTVIAAHVKNAIDRKIKVLVDEQVKAKIAQVMKGLDQ